MPPEKKPGPNPKPVELAQVETLASIGCTNEEIADVVGLSTRQLIRRAKSEHFEEALRRGRNKGRASLRRMQWASAQSGNVTAQIWLGKQMLGQRSFEREEKADPSSAVIPPLIIETYDPSTPESPAPVDAAEPRIP